MFKYKETNIFNLYLKPSSEFDNHLKNPITIQFLTISAMRNVDTLPKIFLFFVCFTVLHYMSAQILLQRGGKWWFGLHHDPQNCGFYINLKYHVHTLFDLTCP